MAYFIEKLQVYVLDNYIKTKATLWNLKMLL